MRMFEKFDPFFLIIILVATFLFLFNLNSRPFWQDEAETACLARNVLRYEIPRAYDGVNLISQEAGLEFGQDYIWRWTPWLQIYITAAAFSIGGFSTTAGRFPFAAFGLICIFLVYFLVRRNFGDLLWARLAAALLATSVPFLLFARQCRYYSLGALLTLVLIYAFLKNWQSKLGPALILGLSLGLLFYTNYLLFYSFIGPGLLAGFLVYYRDMLLSRFFKIMLFTTLLILPGFFVFGIDKQSGMLSLITIPFNLENYFAGLFQFMIPLPLALYLGWMGGGILWSRSEFKGNTQERFIFFLALIILGTVVVLSPVPQCEFRYLVHLYPLCAIILGWLTARAWRYHRFSGVLLAFLLVFTNWLYIVPMDWLHIANRPLHNDRNMLTYPNFPLKLFVIELTHPYPDVNLNLIQFFQSHAHPGDTILTTYGDLPLQFYTPFKVVGGLQGGVSLAKPPDWVVERWETRWNRKYELNESERYIKSRISLIREYQIIRLPWEDEAFGNRPDPYYHRFVPTAHPLTSLTIYHKKSLICNNVP